MRLARLLFPPYVAAVLLVTMWPSPQTPTEQGLVARVVQGLTGLGLPMTVDALEKISNIVMFVPFGVLGAVLLGAGRTIGASAAWTTLAGTALSVLIELTQNFIPGRVSSVLDVVLNGTGALLGAGAVALVRAHAVRARKRILVP